MLWKIWENIRKHQNIRWYMEAELYDNLILEMDGEMEDFLLLCFFGGISCSCWEHLSMVSTELSSKLISFQPVSFFMDK
jgi:hypothetical protein